MRWEVLGKGVDGVPCIRLSRLKLTLANQDSAGVEIYCPDVNVC